MTLDAAATLQTRARRQLATGYCFCHVTAEQIADLCAAYLDAERRRAQIAVLAERLGSELADHDLRAAKVTRGEIVELANLKDSPQA